MTKQDIVALLKAKLGKGYIKHSEPVYARSVRFSITIISLLVSASTLFGQWAVNGNPICIDTSSQDQPIITDDGNGGAYIAWNNTFGFYNLFAQHINCDGSTSWEVNGKYITSSYEVRYPAIVRNDLNSVILSWINANNYQRCIRYSLDGTKPWGDSSMLISSNPNWEIMAWNRACRGNAGSAIISWAQTSLINGYDIYKMGCKWDTSRYRNWRSIVSRNCSR
jgi:hypothetical protein